ncbi:alpha-ribazole phosphatase [Burkholderia thailandensis]|uniref:Alpha-ribazole phosphatase n=4 Tax=Burkholderia thailandensis TaxID=57975 RepID=A0AAW9D161_BURTH|nr:alpha-ribazole phosphatase [Burkholderia thailandensis]AHI64755.1 alpha-ribazole phosphatase [Burkholderia thailandensis H0587]AOJ51644.1 alpha-ribazole phosphatase [Burkholderia thailandensis]AVR23986.1 alpha-ribazole phosphatase [Burkholderia thailandensis]MCS3390336.1 alpha-ribazole phosphatase [Burkholderia thailandensis]MCS6425722.1 alpha-ribazole phosphatase [Burkholderia thailandensis]
MDVVLIRHPAVAIDEGVCYGSSDVPLAAGAAAGAAAILRRLSALGAAPAARASRVWSSPLARCANVARVLADDVRVPVEIDSRLREIDFGAWEMRSWDAIGRDALDRWSADLMHSREHGGESAAQFVARVRPALAALAASASASWVVTHAGVMRALASHALDVPLEALLARPIAMGGIVWLRRDGDRDWRLAHWDE